MLSTREKNRRSNLDFPQLIALNVGDFILGCKFAEHACPLNSGLKLERIEFLTGGGAQTWMVLVFDHPLKAIRKPAGRRVTRPAV
jgi:hypothetical protein